MIGQVLTWLSLAIAGAAVQRASDVIFGESIEKVIYSVFAGRRPGIATLSGEWRSSYDYISDDDGNVHTDQHMFRVSQRGRRVKMKDPGGPGRSRMHVNGTLSDGGVFSGEWEERTVAGRRYSGVVQFLLTRTGNEMRGQWVGFTRNDTVQSGVWTLDRT